MGNIHPVLWIIIGLGVTIVSALMDGLGIFIVVGVVFMFWGIAQFILNQKVQPAVVLKENNIYKPCKHCGAWNYPNATVCHHCRTRV